MVAGQHSAFMGNSLHLWRGARTAPGVACTSGIARTGPTTLEAGVTSPGLSDQLIASVDDAVIALDPQFRVTTWNPGAERLYGFTVAEVLGQDVGGFVRLEMSAAARAGMRRRTAEHGRSRVEAVAIRKDGTRVDVELHNVALRDSEGALTGFLGIHRDVSERRRADRRHQRLAAIVEHSADFIGFADLDGRVLYVNEAGRRLVGLASIEETRETQIPDYFVPRDRGFVRERLLPEVRAHGRWTGERLGDVEVALSHFRTRAPLPVLWDIFRVDDSTTGRPIGFATIARDMSALHASQRRIETILESITDAFYALDHDWRFTYLNERALQMLSQLKGRPLARDDLLGKRVWDEFPSPVRNAAHRSFEEAMREHRTIVVQYRYPDDGPWWDARLFPSDEGLSVYFRDISDEKAAEEERARRARGEALVAELGQRALATEDVQGLLDDAVALLARTLGVDLAKVAELLPSGDRLLLRAGVGWDKGVVGHATEPAGRESQAGYALGAGEPVVADDLAAEPPFGVSPVVREHGAVSAATVVIAGRDRPFGVLGALATRPRAFSRSDVNVMQAVANVLGAAVARREAEHALLAVKEAERRRIARDLHDEALHDLTYALAEADRARRDIAAGTGAGAQRLSALVPALKRIGEQLRGAIYDLRLAGEQDRPFTELLEGLVTAHRAMAAECDVALQLGDGVPAGSLGATGTEVLRILGEALTNARRHAGAGHVRVAVR
ncbi:MAG: hypothetical protein QOC64_3778, partial [Solirubrobacteraceae bacterium]|nr:hypothetical protein [Solirubrobacteraceae bacterium]